MKRLEDNGIISGYGAIINPVKLGMEIFVLINVRLYEQKKGNITSLISAVNSFDEVSECILVTGEFDYVLKVHARNVEVLRDFIVNKLRQIPNVSETSTLLILDPPKKVI